MVDFNHRCGKCLLWEKLPVEENVGKCLARLPLPQWAIDFLDETGKRITKSTDGLRCTYFNSVVGNGETNEPQHQ